MGLKQVRKNTRLFRRWLITYQKTNFHSYMLKRCVYLNAKKIKIKIKNPENFDVAFNWKLILTFSDFLKLMMNINIVI